MKEIFHKTKYALFHIVSIFIGHKQVLHFDNTYTLLRAFPLQYKIYAVNNNPLSLRINYKIIYLYTKQICCRATIGDGADAVQFV